MDESFTKWLIKKIDEDPEKSVAGVAKAAGMDNSAVRRMIEREASPRLDNAVKICEALGTDLVEFLTGGAEGGGPSFPSIPRLDVRLSAGHGAFNSDYTEILDRIPFTQDFLTQKLGRSGTEGLVCVDAHGESMEPTIGDGDLLIVDTKHQDLAAGIYAVNFEDESYVKRVEKVGHGFSLVSDNRAYVPISVQGESLDRFGVIGKVLWAGKMF